MTGRERAEEIAKQYGDECLIEECAAAIRALIAEQCAERDAEIERLHEENEYLNRSQRSLAGERDALDAGHKNLAKEIEQLRAALEDTTDQFRHQRKINTESGEYIVSLRQEIEDWRESARKAAEESCGDEKHCTCVGALRKLIADLEAEIDKLEDELEEHRFV